MWSSGLSGVKRSGINSTLNPVLGTAIKIMPDAQHNIGENFPLQFAWQLPDGDYLRTVFDAEVVDLVPQADKYIVVLRRLLAGRQEDADGTLRPMAVYSKEYWNLVRGLVGRKITVAYEASDGRALHMRLATLTGEHNYFTRYEDAEVMAQGLMAAARKKAQDEGDNE